MPNRTEARLAKAALTNATGRLPPLRLFSTPQVRRRKTVCSTRLQHAGVLVDKNLRFCNNQLSSRAPERMRSGCLGDGFGGGSSSRCFRNASKSSVSVTASSCLGRISLISF
jgi:hypothetical protein